MRKVQFSYEKGYLQEPDKLNEKHGEIDDSGYLLTFVRALYHIPRRIEKSSLKTG
jgi:hypothetical protein